MKTGNPFENINRKEASIALQEYSQGAIIRKKAGRPARPNMGKYLIKMDRALHSQVAQHAASLGINNSFVISQAVHAYFSKMPSSASVEN